MRITRGEIKGPQKVVLYGPEGIGKSSFAAKFPNPVFIDTEGSTKHMDVARTPAPSSWTMLLSQVQYCRDNPHVCETLVVDTVDWAEKLCASHVCAKANKSGIADFGYGNGWVYLAEEFGNLLNALTEVVDAGINVVLTAHAWMRKFEQPDEMGSYDRWEMKLEKKTAPLVKEWADMVLFANYKTYVINVDNQGVEKGKNKAQGGKRVMYATHHPCWDAKNRHGLKDELALDYAEIAHCIPIRSQSPAAVPTTSRTADTKTAAQPERVEDAPTPPEQIEPKAAAVNNVPEIVPDEVPKALADLMAKDGVTVDEIQQACIYRGYYPKGTPFANYDPKFVAGSLVGAWSQLLGVIKQLREEDPFL